MVEGVIDIYVLLLSMQEGHASVCAVCPQHTGCTHADATTDSWNYNTTAFARCTVIIDCCGYGTVVPGTGMRKKIKPHGIDLFN
jgi:hypothetical protein